MKFLEFLDHRCPGWRRLSCWQLNRMMRRMGEFQVGFQHRDGSEEGLLQFIAPSARSYRFQWAGLTISVEEYFRLWYGETLDYPESWLVAISGVRGLFPAEMLIVV